MECSGYAHLHHEQLQHPMVLSFLSSLLLCKGQNLMVITYDDCFTGLQKIEEAGERGELTELVLMVIWNRLDLARRDVR